MCGWLCNFCVDSRKIHTEVGGREYQLQLAVYAKITDDAEGNVKDAQQGGKYHRHCSTRRVSWTVPDKDLTTLAVTAVTV